MGCLFYQNLTIHLVLLHSTSDVSSSESSDQSSSESGEGLRSPQSGGNGENDDWPVGYSWWATGGYPDLSLTHPLNTTEIYQHGDWDSSETKPCDSDILLPEGIGLATQCSVQINPYETAVIGGVDATGKVNNNVSKF